MATTDSLMVDIVAVCRICLQDSETQMVSIYDNDGGQERGGLSICEKIENCSGIKITSATDLPSRICLKCRAFLTLAHKFRQICRRSDDFLREFVCKDLETTATPEEAHYEQLEVLEEELWSNDELIVEVAARADVAAEPVNVPPAVASAPAANTFRDGKYICDICGNGYPRKSTLEVHMRRHRNERPYECEICHKAFHLNYQLMRHIRQHTGAKPYSCQYCQRSFSDRTALVKHERTHRNERPYACRTCGKTFTYASVLKVHYKTHTGEKPHNCELCDKSFARLHNLLAHLQTQQHLNDPRTAAYLQTLKAGGAIEHG